MPAEANGLGDARPATREAPTGADLNGGAQGRLPGRSITFCHVLARASGWCFRVSGSCFCGNFLSARLWPRRTCALRAGALGVKRSFQLGRLSMAAESWRDDGVRRSGETSKSRGKRALECPGRPERAGARRSSCREWHGIFVRRAEMGRPNRRQNEIRKWPTKRCGV